MVLAVQGKQSTADKQSSVQHTFLTSATIPAAASLAARVDTASHTLLMILQSSSLASARMDTSLLSFSDLIFERSLPSLKQEEGHHMDI